VLVRNQLVWGKYLHLDAAMSLARLEEVPTFDAGISLAPSKAKVHSPSSPLLTDNISLSSYERVAILIIGIAPSVSFTRKLKERAKKQSPSTRFADSVNRKVSNPIAKDFNELYPDLIVDTASYESLTSLKNGLGSRTLLNNVFIAPFMWIITSTTSRKVKYSILE